MELIPKALWSTTLNKHITHNLIQAFCSFPSRKYFLAVSHDFLHQIFPGQGGQEATVPLGARGSFLHGGIEESIAKEIQGAAENDAGVVAGLEAGDQEGVLPDRVRVLKRKAVRKAFMDDERRINLWFAAGWNSL